MRRKRRNLRQKRFDMRRRRFVNTIGFLVVLPYLLALPYMVIHPPSTLMIAGWLSFSKVERDWVPLEQISPYLSYAVITSEDSAFCTHWGFDFRQMQKSISRAYESGEDVRATSTISQQLVKNLFLWQGRSWIRKALEAPLTLWIEIFWSKHRILETYLNIVEWGDGIYGAEAASRAHFGKSAANLSMNEAALLATSLPNPIARNAGRPGPAQGMLARNVGRQFTNNAPDTSCIR